MKNEYVKLIEEHDRTLSCLRDFWISLSPGKDKDIMMDRINRALDHRLTLMARRDGETS